MATKRSLIVVIAAFALIGVIAAFIVESNVQNAGFIDKTGKLALSIDGLTDAGEFHDGIAPVLVGKGWGYIDKQGKWIIPPQFKDARNFSEGLAAVRLQSGKFSFINKEAKGIIEVDANEVGDFHNGLAMIVKDGRCGYMNHSGETVIPMMYKAPAIGHPRDASSDVIAVETIPKDQKSEQEMHYIDFENNTIFDRPFIAADKVSEGLAPVCVPLKQKSNPDAPPLRGYGFIGKSGDFVIPPMYANAGPFSDGMAEVGIIGQPPDSRKTLKYSYIDKENKILPVQFDLTKPFSDGLAAVGISNANEISFGYINKQGKYVIPPRFNRANNFSEGVAFTGRKAFSRYPWQAY